MPSVTMTVQIVGQPVTGLWCTGCNLPSGIAIIMRIGARITSRWCCRDCGRDL